MCCSLAVALVIEAQQQQQISAGLSIQLFLLSKMAQQSPHTGTGGTAFKNRPEVKQQRGNKNRTEKMRHLTIQRN